MAPSPEERKLAQRKTVHYFGYFIPIVIIGLGVVGLIITPTGRTREGMIVVGLLSLGALAVGGLMAWWHSREDYTTPTIALEDLPLPEQAHQVRRYIWTTAVATVLFSGYIAYDLMRVEYGGARNVKIWFVVADLYNNFGFWPAVLCFPVLGGMGVLALVWKLRSIK